MKRTVLLFLFLPFFFASNCKKEECISGTVSDSKTGKPIPGAYVNLTYKYQEHGSLKRKDQTEITDNSGNYTFCTSDNGYHLGVHSVNKIGYSSIFSRIDGDITLTPLDGTIKLFVSNETGTFDSIFVQVFNKCEYSDYNRNGIHATHPSPLKLQPDETHTETFAACAGDSSNVQWWTSYLSSYVGIDSLLIKTGDTTYYHLKY